MHLLILAKWKKGGAAIVVAAAPATALPLSPTLCVCPSPVCLCSSPLPPPACVCHSSMSLPHLYLSPLAHSCLFTPLGCVPLFAFVWPCPCLYHPPACLFVLVYAHSAVHYHLAFIHTHLALPMLVPIPLLAHSCLFVPTQLRTFIWPSFTLIWSLFALV